MDVFEFVGVLGFIVYIFAYAMLQAGRLDGNKAGYTLLNLLAASLVLISLTDKFNLASVLIQLSWISISLWGLSKLFFAKMHKPVSRSELNKNPSQFQVWSGTYLCRLYKLWSLRFTVQRERRSLREMDDHLLNDIGIQRADADREARKRFTDVPVTRLQQHNHMEATGMDARGRDWRVSSKRSKLNPLCVTVPEHS